MARRSITSELLRQLQVGVASNRLGQVLYEALVGIANYKPATQWFNAPVTSANGEAPTPGTWDWASGAPYGRVHIEQDKTISAVHLHVELDATTSGTLRVELWRNRGQTFSGPGAPGDLVLIASAEQVHGAGNGSCTSFSFVDENYKDLISGDYLHMQVTSRMSGGSWRAFVDVHYSETGT